LISHPAFPVSSPDNFHMPSPARYNLPPLQPGFVPPRFVPPRFEGRSAPQEEPSPTRIRLTAPDLCRHAITAVQRTSNHWSWPSAASSIWPRTGSALDPDAPGIRDAGSNVPSPPSIFNHGGIHPFPISRRSWSAHVLPWPATKRLVLPLRVLLSRIIILPPSSSHRPVAVVATRSLPSNLLFGSQAEPSEDRGPV
jgi:hypothetical protein